MLAWITDDFQLKTPANKFQHSSLMVSLILTFVVNHRYFQICLAITESSYLQCQWDTTIFTSDFIKHLTISGVF